MAHANDVSIRPATEADLGAIDEIYNDAILTTTATWDEVPWTPEQRLAWFLALDASMPVLVAETGGRIAGFAYLSLYRTKVGYRFTREDTIYIHGDFRGQGIGTQLLGALVARARELGLHCLIAAIAGENEPSIALHRRLGFTVAGTKKECGIKFGRWLDLTEMTLILSPASGTTPPGR
ncbi:MAG: GNAT family N-acetyltransferase [Dehalococcoidia bacterium]